MFYCPKCNAKVSVKARSCEHCGHVLGKETSSPEPISRPGLIRPVGATPPPIRPPDPITPPALAALHPQTFQVAPPNAPQSQQFMRPAFLPSKGQQSSSEVLPTNQHPIEVVRGRPPLIEADEQFNQFDDGAESYVATSVAAEHWRTSWRKRQRSGTGSTVDVSRGHSAVPEPLLAVKRTAIASQDKREKASPRLWIALFLMICLMGGLGVYIASTFAPNSDNAAHSNAPISADIPQPALTIQGTPIASIAQGQTLHVHGVNFDAGAPIIFLLDGAIAISGLNGREIAILASDEGTFDAGLPVTMTWTAGQHVIQAQDNQNSQSAYLFMRVSLADSAPSAKADLSLSLTNLTFQALAGPGKPQEKFIKLTNNTSSPLQWTATAFAANNLSWLSIDDTTGSGSLHARATGTVSVWVNAVGLQSNATPYTGKIVFTVNSLEQLTLAVELQVQIE